MMELIHDVAPGAVLAFHTASGGQPVFEQGILALAEAGCDVIVDDVIYFAEPFFLDGIIAKAADQVVGQGIPYFASAGNFARSSWAGAYKNSGIPGPNGGRLHEFAAGITMQKLTFNIGDSTVLTFQWDEPFSSVSGPPGSSSNMDLHIYKSDGGAGFELLLSFEDNNIGRDPVEFMSFEPEAELFIAIELVQGPDPGLMQWVALGNRPLTIEFDTQSGTSYGHFNSANTAAVGAADFVDTPRFGVDSGIPLLEDFSSAGGIPILFDENGERLENPEIRRTPLVVGPDGIQTTFFSGAGPIFRFFGTSAAAPNVAALAGLLLEFDNSLTPCEIYEALAETAIDMDDEAIDEIQGGFDFGTGFGFVDGEAAIDYVATEFGDNRNRKLLKEKTEEENSKQGRRKGRIGLKTRKLGKGKGKGPTSNESPTKSPTAPPSKDESPPEFQGCPYTASVDLLKMKDWR